MKGVVESLNGDIENLEATSKRLIERKLSSFDRLETLIITMTILALLLGIGSTILTTRSIVTPIHQLNRIIQDLGRGSIPELNINETSDEIGDIVQSVKKLRASLISTSTFAQEIGEGNLDAKHELLSEDDVLGKALLNMKENLSVCN